MKSKLLIRPAVPTDRDAVHALVERAYRGDSARQGWTHEADLLDGQRTDAAAIDAIIGDTEQCLLLAEHEGQLTGCVQVSATGPANAYLGMLSVDPTAQAGGLGRQLIAAAERTARERFGARRMEMTVIRQRTALIRYYERRGYALTGEERPFPYGDLRFGTPRRDDLSFVVLAKDLTAT